MVNDFMIRNDGGGAFRTDPNNFNLIREAFFDKREIHVGISEQKDSSIEAWIAEYSLAHKYEDGSVEYRAKLIGEDGEFEVFAKEFPLYVKLRELMDRYPNVHRITVEFGNGLSTDFVRTEKVRIGKVDGK